MLGPFDDLVAQVQQCIWSISVASMTLGALAAISQTNIKRLMAYSSIGHIGYALIGLAAGTVSGVNGILVYLTIYITMNIGTFRSEEHTSELQSLMRISYAVFCLKKKKITNKLQV